MPNKLKLKETHKQSTINIFVKGKQDSIRYDDINNLSMREDNYGNLTIDFVQDNIAYELEIMVDKIIEIYVYDYMSNTYEGEASNE